MALQTSMILQVNAIWFHPIGSKAIPATNPTTCVPKDSFTSQMPALSVSWLVAGGLLYTGGVPFFMLADYRLSTHDSCLHDWKVRTSPHRSRFQMICCWVLTCVNVTHFLPYKVSLKYQKAPKMSRFLDEFSLVPVLVAQRETVRPIHHVIWHLFVAAAAICHWIVWSSAGKTSPWRLCATTRANTLAANEVPEEHRYTYIYRMVHLSYIWFCRFAAVRHWNSEQTAISSYYILLVSPL